MAFLVCGDVTVKVAVDRAAVKREQLGEVVRSFNGEPRSSVRAVLFDWSVQTPPLTASDAAALLAVLEGAHPITCSGDFLGGSVACVPVDINTTPVKVSGATRYSSVSFRLLGAGA